MNETDDCQPSDNDSMGDDIEFERASHIRYFMLSLHQLPSAYSSLDTNRLTLVHFSIQSLDLLGVLHNEGDKRSSQIDRVSITEWIMSLYSNDGSGFKGGTFIGPSTGFNQYDHSHVAMTYTALATLVALHNNVDVNSKDKLPSFLEKIDKKKIISNLRDLQREDGSFQCVSGMESEHDMRFLYCAIAISYMLNDWSGVDIPRAISFILSCRSYDGAIALLPGQEGHGGSTFCAIASLYLMGELQNQLSDDWRKHLIYWCVQRQIKGMQGRPNKLEDTCYSYWIGGTLHLLDEHHLLHQTLLRKYVLSCQTDMGGFSKVLYSHPDLLHSYYSLAWLSLHQSEQRQHKSCKTMSKEVMVEKSKKRADYKCDGHYINFHLRDLNCALGVTSQTAEFVRIFCSLT